MSTESDEDLLIYMSMQVDDPSVARDAWGEFYIRHRKFVFVICTKFLEGAKSVIEAGDLVGETFACVLRSAHTFKSDNLQGNALRKRIRLWLTKIAKNCFLKWKNREAQLPIELMDQVSLERLQNDPFTFTTSPESIAIQGALESLTEREQLVIRVTASYYQPGQVHQRLPNDVAADLARTLDTTPENLRQIRSRALKKIQAYLHSQNL